jgi:hypothetical protein
VEKVKTNRETPEMTRFNEALHEVMQVSKTDLNRLLHDKKAIAEVRQRKGPKPKPSVSGRASREKD